MNERGVGRVEALFARYPELGEQWWCQSCAELTLEDGCSSCGGPVSRFRVIPLSAIEKLAGELEAEADEARHQGYPALIYDTIRSCASRLRNLIDTEGGE